MLELSKRKEAGTRGKYAEDQVRNALKALSALRADFDYERNYDARTSMGRIPARAGDFTIFDAGSHGIIEVKQVDHDYRLPKKNFDPKKFGKIRMRQLAGGKVSVLVYFTPSKLWRVVPFEYFYARKDQPSWDLREFSHLPNVHAALASEGIR
jgi:hypothetical protein